MVSIVRVVGQDWNGIMSDLIKREDVVEALYQAIRTTLTGTFTDSMSLAIAMANNLPSVESEERTVKVVDIFCGNCGRALIGDESYCDRCGCKLEWK